MTRKKMKEIHIKNEVIIGCIIGTGNIDVSSHIS
jgi:hypothetical protein